MACQDCAKPAPEVRNYINRLGAVRPAWVAGPQMC